MAQTQYRKRKSNVLDDRNDGPEASNPIASPARKRTKITQSQKQALIDNLQLEITERARHLRAHYALQSSDLRSRIERRINRIPTSLRKANMAEMLSKYSETVLNEPSATQEAAVAPSTTYNTTTNVPASESHPLPPIPLTSSSKPSSPARPEAPASRPVKRVSNDEVHIASDKENEDSAGQSTDALPTLKNPKRVKAGGPASRVASRTGRTTSVLSPKSHNSRTLPRSPIKDYPSPTKQHSFIARPTSPLKPASPLKAAATVATNAISASLHGMVEHAKRSAGATARGLTRTASKEKVTTSKSTKSMAPPPRPLPQPRQQQEPTRTISSASTHSNSSNLSASSTSTTVVKKGGRADATESQKTMDKKGPAATRTAMKKTTGTTAPKKVVVAEPAAGRRVLRTRK